MRRRQIEVTVITELMRERACLHVNPKNCLEGSELTPTKYTSLRDHVSRAIVLGLIKVYGTCESFVLSDFK